MEEACKDIPLIATGVPKPAQPSIKAPKKLNKNQLHAPVVRD
jgi:hypothetical protein